MLGQSLNLPINVPWCQIAVTEQMLDRRFGDKRFPTPWRSSIALSAYEPKIEDLPIEFGKKRITYLKVTCSITGYQPSPDETDRGYADLDDGSASFRLIFEEYLACYGVMLNVAVFSATTRKRGAVTSIQISDDVDDYPHIIALEPKNRDLYQAATESGEVLTASNSKVSTDKTFTQTESSETGVNLSGTYGVKDGPNISGGLTHKWGETNQDSSNIQTDASRERRETQGTTTQLSQMYNLLTGYHQGTNRATFQMLPRPHTLQATDKRTFMQGLQMIKGVQEFLLIVERPSKINSLCIEAFLETGHFPEDAELTNSKQKYEEVDVRKHWGPKYALVKIQEFLGIGNRSRGTTQIDTSITIEHLGENSEFELDVSKGDLTTPGISEIILPDDTAEGFSSGRGNRHETKKLLDYVVNFESPNQLSIQGKIKSSFEKNTTFDRDWIIHLRKPKTEPSEPHTTVTDLLITQRSLEVCIKSGDGCPEVVKSTILPVGGGENTDVAFHRESIVDERKIRINSTLLTNQAINESRLPATQEVLRKIGNAMTTSGRQRSRYPAGKVGYLETDYFKNRVSKILPKETLEKRLTCLKGLPKSVAKNLGEECTVAEALQLDLPDFSKKTGLSIEDAVKVRRSLLGLKMKPYRSDVDAGNVSKKE